MVSIAVGVLAIAAWREAPAIALALDAFSDWLTPHRHAWYALPLVVSAFVLLGLLMVPVLLLIAATGVAFGPWLGPCYAMAGCLASASIGFAIGRWTGVGRIERFGGDRMTRAVRSIERNGTLAVFLLRKIPAPFLIANVIAGASNVTFRDFLIGTVLGMTAGVVALAGFGYQLTHLYHDPTPLTVATAAVAVGIPLTIAWGVNRMLRQPEPTP